MLIRPRFDQADRLCTEQLKVGIPLNLKTALTETARRQGKSVSGLVREAVTVAIDRDTKTRVR